VIWHTPPACQGQIVEVSYSARDGVAFRRTHDRSDGETSYASADMADCDTFEPWNNEPEGLEWAPCDAPSEPS
jgi:hypothetical protein